MRWVIKKRTACEFLIQTSPVLIIVARRELLTSIAEAQRSSSFGMAVKSMLSCAATAAPPLVPSAAVVAEVLVASPPSPDCAAMSTSMSTSTMTSAVSVARAASWRLYATLLALALN
jgi:hypothetical protein